MQKNIFKIISIAALIIISIIIVLCLMIVLDSPLLYPLEKEIYIIVDVDDVVTYDELETPPDYVDTYMCRWFNSLSPITTFKLRSYMKKNNLVILPEKYFFNNTIRFEELKDILQFEKVKEKTGDG